MLKSIPSDLSTSAYHPATIRWVPSATHLLISRRLESWVTAREGSQPIHPGVLDWTCINANKFIGFPPLIYQKCCRCLCSYMPVGITVAQWVEYSNVVGLIPTSSCNLLKCPWARHLTNCISSTCWCMSVYVLSTKVFLKCLRQSLWLKTCCKVSVHFTFSELITGS